MDDLGSQISPFEFGSWDPNLSAMMNLTYAGTHLTDGQPDNGTACAKCASGFFLNSDGNCEGASLAIRSYACVLMFLGSLQPRMHAVRGRQRRVPDVQDRFHPERERPHAVHRPTGDDVYWHRLPRW